MSKTFQIITKLQPSSKKKAHITSLIKMVKPQICFILICVFLGVSQALVPDECSQGGLVPEEVVIEGCEADATICPVKFNGLLNMTMKFKAPHYMESMKPKMMVKTSFVNFELRGKYGNTDVCSGILNTLCPVVEKELVEYKYTTMLTVLPFIPITLEFSILDTVLNETAICFTVNANPSKF